MPGRKVFFPRGAYVDVIIFRFHHGKRICHLDSGAGSRKEKGLLVLMAVMRIGEVGMAVFQSCMSVRMPMHRSRRHYLVMRVLMMVVMHMRVLMLQFVVDMAMRMLFRQMQPDAEGHQYAGQHQRRCQRLTHD